jgi:hypothetical protein
MMPSFAPNTAARNHPILLTRWLSLWRRLINFLSPLEENCQGCEHVRYSKGEPPLHGKGQIKQRFDQGPLMALS